MYFLCGRDSLYKSVSANDATLCFSYPFVSDISLTVQVCLDLILFFTQYFSTIATSITCTQITLPLKHLGLQGF